MEVQEQLNLFYWMRLGTGVFVAISALLYLYSIFGPAREDKPERLFAPMRPLPQPAE